MSVFLQPIYTQTVGSGGAATVTFNNIPQTFTDLKLVFSGRTTQSSYIDDNTVITFNAVNSGYSFTYMGGSGSAASSGRGSSTANVIAGRANGSTATANTFSNNEIYIPNYASSNYKSFIIDSVAENNTGTTTYGLFLESGLWSNTSAINSLTFAGNGNFVQYSTFSLYGVLRQGI